MQQLLKVSEAHVELKVLEDDMLSTTEAPQNITLTENVTLNQKCHTSLPICHTSLPK